MRVNLKRRRSDTPAVRYRPWPEAVSALGFARVFELPLEELMSPPPEGVDLEGRRVVQEAVEAFYESRDAQDRLHRAVVAIADYLGAHRDGSKGIHQQCLRLMGEERDARALTEYIESGGYHH